MSSHLRALILLLAIAAGAAQADNAWRTADTWREVTWQAVNLADMGTTMDGQRQPARYQERNPLIGAHASPERVAWRMGLGAVAHAGVSYLLPHGWRDAWQYMTIGTSAHCLKGNLEIGLEVRF